MEPRMTPADMPHKCPKCETHYAQPQSCDWCPGERTERIPAVPAGSADLQAQSAQARGMFDAAVALLRECLGPLEVSAAVIESEDGGEAIETLIGQVRKFCADAASVVAGAGVQAKAACRTETECSQPDACRATGGCERMEDAPNGAVDALHRDIMNLPCCPREGTSDAYQIGFYAGHRDARHAAAELAASAIAPKAEGFRSVGKADFHMSAEMDVVIGTELFIKDAAASSASGWQPIETAPKDGSHIIVSNGVAVSLGWWCDEPGYIREVRDLEGRYLDQHESDGFQGWLDCDGGMQPDPTHWQPLPPPPGAAPSLSADPQARDAAMLWLGSVRDEFRRISGEANRTLSEHVSASLSADARDAQRYRWLRDRRGDQKEGDHMNPPLAQISFTAYAPGVIGPGPTIDAAIDAAMKEQPQ